MTCAAKDGPKIEVSPVYPPEFVAGSEPSQPVSEGWTTYESIPLEDGSELRYQVRRFEGKCQKRICHLGEPIPVSDAEGGALFLTAHYGPIVEAQPLALTTWELFGQRLKESLARQSMTLGQLDARLGRHRTYTSSIIADRRDLDEQAVAEIATALGVTPESLTDEPTADHGDSVFNPLSDEFVSDLKSRCHRHIVGGYLRPFLSPAQLLSLLMEIEESREIVRPLRYLTNTGGASIEFHTPKNNATTQPKRAVIAMRSSRTRWETVRVDGSNLGHALGNAMQAIGPWI